jgi:tRNA-specific 2-thiouridylase
VIFKKAQKNKPKVALGMSGGVDSSVAAYLLLKQGYDVTGVFMQCWDARADGCKADEDRAFAVKNAAKLGIPFETLDFRGQYNNRVMKYFYDEYQAGRTPNPDVMCNKEIKFGLFYDWAMEKGFDFVSTGHYARVKKGLFGGFNILKGKDVTKDQSYFLYLLRQEQLAKTLFPVGNMTKKDLRKLAVKLDLPSAARPDSMGICFIGEVDIKDFLKKHIAEKSGDVVDTFGEVIGTHEGVWFYTIGQRHGFKINKYFGHPLYVVSKDVENNVLVVGKESDTVIDNFYVLDPHWIHNKLVKNLNCDVRIRHLGGLHKATVTVQEGLLHVQLNKPIFAVAPGQSAVFYKGDVMLGGGVIK